MDEVLKKDIEKAITKNMPQAVGQTLQKLLREAESNSKKVIDQQKQIEKLTQDLSKTSKLLNDIEELKNRKKEIENKEKEIEKRELYLDKFILEIKLKEAEERNNNTFQLVDKLMRNTIFRKNILDTENKGGLPIIDGQGSAHYPVPSSRNFQETKEEE